VVFTSLQPFVGQFNSDFCEVTFFPGAWVFNICRVILQLTMRQLFINALQHNYWRSVGLLVLQFFKRCYTVYIEKLGKGEKNSITSRQPSSDLHSNAYRKIPSSHTDLICIFSNLLARIKLQLLFPSLQSTSWLPEIGSWCMCLTDFTLYVSHICNEVTLLLFRSGIVIFGVTVTGVSYLHAKLNFFKYGVNSNSYPSLGANNWKLYIYFTYMFNDTSCCNVQLYFLTGPKVWRQPKPL